MVEITERAAEKARAVRDAQGVADQGVRIAVVGGGCSGLQYAFSFDTPSEMDYVIDVNGITFLVDPQSSTYLEGARVDYEEGLNGSGFKITNPQARSTCGCGHSFRA